MINFDIAKYSLILPIIACIYELLTIIRYNKKEDYINKKLNSRIYRVEDKKQMKNTLILNIIFILGLIIFYILKRPEANRLYFFNVIFLNLIILGLYFILNSLNNIKIRNGIYENGIFFMGKVYKWDKIKNIRINKEKSRIEIIRKIPFLGEIETRIRYSDQKFLKYLKKLENTKIIFRKE
ncbi:MAG: hypothetical protein ACQEQE_05705 [Bacillota bacterium]